MTHGITQMEKVLFPNHYSVFRAIMSAWLLAIAILISPVHFNAAQARDVLKKGGVALAQACGKEMKKLCSDLPVRAGGQLGGGSGQLLACLYASEKKLSAQCIALGDNVVRGCDRDAAQLCQGVVASAHGNIIGCLTMARNVVSAQCNSAIDAAFLRQ